FERRAIDNVDKTAAVTNEAGALQQAGRDRHGGAAHTEHLPETFLRQRDRVAIDAIMRLQQPAAKPRLQRVERVARDRLLDLRKQQVVVAHDARSLPPRRAASPRARAGSSADAAPIEKSRAAATPPRIG